MSGIFMLEFLRTWGFVLRSNCELLCVFCLPISFWFHPSFQKLRNCDELETVPLKVRNDRGNAYAVVGMPTHHPFINLD
jgi:uncharacterized Fe-S radical SAM superfamily protein PflX